MKISFAVCTHNEGHYVRDLLTRLTKFVNEEQTLGSSHEYEIIVVDDYSDEETAEIITEFLWENPRSVQVFHHALNGDFAAHKNYMTTQCSGDWILNLDADESLPVEFLEILPMILEANPEIDAYWLPRVNTVDGLTLEHVRRWGWILTTRPGFRTVRYMGVSDAYYQLLDAYKFIANIEDGWVTFDEPMINWPDWQMRLYRNSPQIRWEGAVHERLVGYEHYTFVPEDTNYAIRHHKEIARQEQQNALYSKMQSRALGENNATSNS